MVCRGPVLNRRWFRGQDLLPQVAIVWHGESNFKTYNNVLTIQSGWHDPVRFSAPMASRLASVIDLDQGIQFVEVQADFNSI